MQNRHRERSLDGVAIASALAAKLVSVVEGLFVILGSKLKVREHV